MEWPDPGQLAGGPNLRTSKMTTRRWMILVIVTAVFAKAGIVAGRLKAHASVLRKHQAAVNCFEEGRVTLAQTVLSSERLLEAELAICLTSAQRLTAISAHLKRAHLWIEREKREIPWCRATKRREEEIADAKAALVAWETALKALNGPQ